MRNFNNLRIVAASLVFTLACVACDDEKPAELRNRIVMEQMTGNADDGDSATPPDEYKPADTDRQAVDRETTARSLSNRYNQLSGSVAAKAVDPGATTVTADAAVANSYNKVVSVLKVNARGVYRFKTSLAIAGLYLHGNSQITIQVSANLLDRKGAAVPGGRLVLVEYEAKQNAQGVTVLTIDQKVAPQNPEDVNIDASGNYTDGDRFGPSQNGLQIQDIGEYRVEFDLRIHAVAPMERATDGQATEARVDSVSVSIELVD